MFDTFDLLLPELLPVPHLRVQQRESVFGVDEARYAYLGEIKLGRTMVARDAFTAIEAWTGAPGREDWTVLRLRSEANAAAHNDDTWREFLAAIVTVLEAHAAWRVTCESDCDQHPVERLELTPEALVALLDSYRESHFFPTPSALKPWPLRGRLAALPNRALLRKTALPRFARSGIRRRTPIR